MKWSTFRDVIRRSILADTNALNWSNEQLADYIGWALDRFALHTALPKEIAFNAATEKSEGVFYNMSVDTTFIMPDDVFEDLTISGMIYVTDAYGKRQYIDPINRTDGVTPMNRNGQYFETWGDKLLFTQPVGASSSITVRYFAMYPMPRLDTDILNLPRWAYVAIAHLVGYYALTAPAIDSANIDRWKDRNDSGQPETNALAQQQRQMLSVYERLLENYPRQDRDNFFRSLHV